MNNGNLLILGDYPIGYGNGIGETLSNLLETWPDDRIFDMHPEKMQPLPGRGRGRSIPFSWPRPPAWLPAVGRLPYKPLLKIRQAAASRELVRAAAAAIREHHIDAVLTYPVTPWILFAAVQLRRAFPDVRFVFYVMDDWAGHHMCFGLPFTARRRAALAEMIATSDVRFACSHLMQRDYERRFATSWNVVHKGVQVPSALPARSDRRIWRILYTGGMNMFRFDAVLAFAEGLRLFREQSGRDVTLTLLGPEPDAEYASALAPYSFIRTQPWVDNATCQQRMTEADFLYLPLSFAPRLERITHLAMPAKFSEYLASGTPAIFHVPRESEVFDLATQAGLSSTLDTLDPLKIRDFLVRLNSPAFDETAYQRGARRLLHDEFDETVLRLRFHNACFGDVSRVA